MRLKYLLLGSLIYIGSVFSHGERANILNVMAGEWIAKGVYTATKLRVAEHLEEGAKRVEELAEELELDVDSLGRILHMLDGYGIFKEISPGIFTNSSSSALLSRNHPDSLSDIVLFYGEDMHDAFEGLLPAMKSGKTAFEHTFNQPVFTYFKNNPKRKMLFHSAMRQKSRAVINSIVESYDFRFCETVYDIGGGHGQFLNALMQEYPNISGLLFDLPEVISTLSCKQFDCHQGDFFLTIPSGGDIYILKSVIHDWDDAKAVQILKNCKQAMKKGSKLLIVDVVLSSDIQSRYANCMDVLMLAVTGGKERSMDQFKSLISAADLKLSGVYRTDTEFSILELTK